MIIGLRLGFIPRLRNDGKGIVYENGLGTFAHGVGIGHQSGAGVLHPDEGILAGIGVGLCLQHLCGYDGMIFCRWTADAIGKAIKLDWEKFV